jgi:cob(I)alamin adenosyltransferase
MKLYTRTGDRGKTGLIGGARVEKNCLRLEAYGCVDELNATIGFALAACDDAAVRDRLEIIQRDLLAMGAELATPPSGDKPPVTISESDVKRLEEWIDESMSTTPPLTQFILPNGVESAARLHVTRTVCRRAERRVVQLAHSDRVGQALMSYLNRLSDLLFAWARQCNYQAGVSETPWSGDERASPK